MTARRGRRHAAAAAALFLSAAFALTRVRAAYTVPFPRFDALMVAREGTQDLAFIAGGYRTVAADIAWIQLLQYAGGDVLEGEDPDRKFDLIGYYTRRVVRIDPQFHRAYLFGAGILAYFRNVNRPEEALALLDEGIANNPDAWQLQTFRASIALKTDAKDDAMIEKLEEAVAHPDCPAVIKSILANIHSRRGEYLKAVAVWERVLNNDKDLDYWPKARSEIRKIGELLSSGSRPRTRESSAR